jgi:predicted AlkP superfamily pyrophosphatase or phosphodiesterase
MSFDHIQSRCPFFRRILPVIFLALFTSSALMSFSQQAAPTNRILILISLDAFRSDYLQKFNPSNLNRLAGEGVHAEKLIPMFPSMTFPNHHTIATGFFPEHHGIIHNEFYDPAFKEKFNIFNNPGPTDGKWWGGQPIWVTAVKQGHKAYCGYWPGVAAEIDGRRPTEYKAFDAKVEPDGVTDTALTWLSQPAEKRPDLLVLYYYHADHVGHDFGPDSAEMPPTVKKVDDAIGKLLDGVHRLNLDAQANFVIVSDHGMVGVSTSRMIILSEFVEPEKVQVDFSGAVAGLRPLQGDAEALYQKFAGKEKHFKVYRREETPPEYHFRNNPRIPPVILVADDAWYLSKRSVNDQSRRGFKAATHGYDPNLASMGATFIAWGPAFRKNTTLKPVENVHIYNLLCATLGLTPAPNDGDDRLVRQVLVPN